MFDNASYLDCIKWYKISLFQQQTFRKWRIPISLLSLYEHNPKPKMSIPSKSIKIYEGVAMQLKGMVGHKDKVYRVIRGIKYEHREEV